MKRPQLLHCQDPAGVVTAPRQGRPWTREDEARAFAFLALLVASSVVTIAFLYWLIVGLWAVAG